MRFAHHLVLQLVDPRGRADRRDFLHAAIALFVLQCLCLAAIKAFDVYAEGAWLVPGNAAFVYMAYAATSRRLHDMGRSAWWMPAAIAVWAVAGFLLALVLALVLGAQAIGPGRPGFWVTFACLVSVPLATAIWLHVTPGSDGPNQFGPPSDEGEEPRSRRDMIPALLVPAE